MMPWGSPRTSVYHTDLFKPVHLRTPPTRTCSNLFTWDLPSHICSPYIYWQVGGWPSTERPSWLVIYLQYWRLDLRLGRSYDLFRCNFTISCTKSTISFSFDVFIYRKYLKGHAGYEKSYGNPGVPDPKDHTGQSNQNRLSRTLDKSPKLPKT